jgi:hypothetical protein
MKPHMKTSELDLQRKEKGDKVKGEPKNDEMGKHIKRDKTHKNQQDLKGHVNCTLPPLPIHGELFINIPLLQVPLHSLCPHQGWSTSTSLHILRTPNYSDKHWCLFKSSLVMSKPSQTMLHKLLLNWRHSYSLSYIIILDSISPCVATYPAQHTNLCHT